MKKAVPALFLIVIFTSCGSVNYARNFLKERLTVQQAVDWKEDMDKSENPAYEFKKTRELENKRIKIEKAKVYDIIGSSNVDYKFCVIVKVPTDKGLIDCYIYAGGADIFPQEDIKTVSKLKKGKSVIYAEGNFSRFYPRLDEAFTKIEIVNTKIKIIGE